MGHYRPPQRTESKAIASLVLGLSSLMCLGAITGLPAVILGSLARKEIDRSSGTLTGRGIAAGGIVTGLFGTGLGFVMLLFVLGGALESKATSSLEVVDLRDDRPFGAQLMTVVEESKTSGRKVLLQTHSQKDVRCAQIAAALPDARVQRALTNVTLVRVDVDRFGPELHAMKIETKSAPYFYRLDDEALPIDAMSGRDVDPAAPEKMGPKLAAFVRQSNAVKRR
jgi:hypothetical protein